MNSFTGVTQRIISSTTLRAQRRFVTQTGQLVGGTSVTGTTRSGNALVSTRFEAGTPNTATPIQGVGAVPEPVAPGDGRKGARVAVSDHEPLGGRLVGGLEAVVDGVEPTGGAMPP